MSTLSVSAPARIGGLSGSKKKQLANPNALAEKDEVELALEKAVFGDELGFEEALQEAGVPEFESDDQSRYESVTDSDEADEDEDGDEEKVKFNLDNLHNDELFIVDGVNDVGISPLITRDQSPEKKVMHDNRIKAAWYDEDDERLSISLASNDRLRKLRLTEDDDLISGIEYSARLRAQFNRLYPIPDWAKPKPKRKLAEETAVENDSSDDYEAEDEKELTLRADPLKKLLQSTAKYTAGRFSKKLPSGSIDIARLRDANAQAISQSAVQSITFHPSLPLLMSAGFDRTLRIYNVDGKHNTLATSLHFRSSPIQTAEFHADGKRVFAGGRRRYFYIWDLETGSADLISRMYGHEEHQKTMERFKLSPCGRFMGLVGSGGWINILDATNGQWISGAKIEGGAAVDFVWSADGGKIDIVNSAGEVWEWSTSERRFVSRWADFGGVGITSIAATEKYVALGSQSGIVNVYDSSRYRSNSSDQQQPNLIYTLDQLVTPISSLTFSHDGQVLSMASRSKKDALRFAHMATGTVFKNWPTSGTPLGKVTATTFSPSSEMFAAANEAGKVRLFKLNHYS
ncbi:WD40-repeat-containing domain protein [Lipomyces oligophaga]|uniref:WD40-repeat-containing domain protein n=1 Tax=Lipomyces oligophaga TaxID=45792 RepID=UPI0034CEBE01